MAEPSDLIDAILAIIILVVFAPVISTLTGQLGGEFAQLIQIVYAVGFLALVVGLLLVIASIIEELL
jgi:hypothetical protein